MKDIQKQTRRKALKKLKSLKADFESVAADTRKNKILWPKKYPKRFMAEMFEDYAVTMGEMIDTLTTSKKVEVYPDSYGFIKGRNPLENIGHGISPDCFAKAANESPRNKNAADLYREFARAIDEILPLLKQIPSTVMAEETRTRLTCRGKTCKP